MTRFWRLISRIFGRGEPNTYVTAGEANDYFQALCTHPRARVHKWVENNTPMIDTYCPDCGYHDHGHVHGDIDGWADE